MDESILLSLQFKDQFIEKEFKASQYRFHQKCFFILTLVLVTQSSIIFFSNPLEMEIYDPILVTGFVLSTLLVVCIHILIRKKFPTFTDKGITLFVFTYITCSAEVIHQIQKSITLAPWVYFLLGINIQTGCLFLMMSRIRWTHSIFVIVSTHIYSWFRIIDIIDKPGAEKTAFMSLTIHILIILGLTYSNEKEIRLTFQKIRAHSCQLISFEEIIKSIIESAIIILRDDDVVFFNNKTKKILDVNNNNEVIDLLNAIHVKKP